MLAGSAVGGGTLVNWMTSLPGAGVGPRGLAARPRDRGRDRRRPGTPTSRPSRRELGVAESTVIPPKDAAILRGAAALGWEADPTRRNATDCGDCGSCPFGCRRGTKQSGIRAHLAAAARRRGTDRAARPGDERPRSRAAAPSASRATRSGRTPRPGEPDLGRPNAPTRRPGAGRRRCCRRAADAGAPAGVRVSGTRRSAGTCGSTRCRSSPGSSPSRSTCGAGTMQAARSTRVRRAARRQQRLRHRVGARAIPASWRSRCRGRAPTPTPTLMLPGPPHRAADRRHPRRRRGPDDA